jgi:hypothetical protein
MHNVAEVDNVAKAVLERRQLDLKEKAEIKNFNGQIMATLPEHYQWLKQWENV